MAERNDCTCPAAAGGAPGWSFSGGSGAVGTGVTGTAGMDRTTAYRLTNGASAANSWVFAPPVAVTPGQQVPVTIQGRPTAAVTCAMQVYFYDSAGVSVGSPVSTTNTAVAANANLRPTATVTVPAGVARLRVAFLAINLPANQILRVTGARYGGTAYADGDTAGWAYEGAAGTSTSTKVQAEEYGPASVGQGTGSAVVAKPAGSVADAEPATLTFRGTAGTVVSAIVQRFRYVDPTNPLKAGPAFGGNNTTTPVAHVAPSVAWDDRDALSCSWGLRTAFGTWTGPATMPNAVVAPGTGDHKARAGSEPWSSGTTSGTRTATYSTNSRWHAMSASVRGAVAGAGLGVELLVAHIYLDSNGSLGDLQLPFGWTLAGSAANATANTLVHAALAYKIVATGPAQVGLTWAGDYSAVRTPSGYGFTNVQYQPDGGAIVNNYTGAAIAGVSHPSLGNALRLTLNPDECRIEATPPSEVSYFGEGADAYFRFDFVLDSNFEIGATNRHHAISQIHSASATASPPLEFDVVNGGLYTRGASDAPEYNLLYRRLCDLTAGVKYSVIFRVKFSATAANCLVEVWVNGVKLLSEVPTHAMLNGGGPSYWKGATFYRASAYTSTETLWQSNHAIGTTYAALAGLSNGNAAAYGNPPVSTLASDFTVTPAFFTANFGGVSIVDGQGQAPTVNSYSAWSTGTNLYSLTGSALFVGVPQASGTGGSRQNSLKFEIDAQNAIEMSMDGGTFKGRVQKAGAFTDTALGAYSPTADFYWRVREAGGVVYWDSSPDAVTWTNRGQATHGLDVSAVKVNLQAGYWNAAETGGPFPPAIYDNLNVVPSPGAQPGAGAIVSGTLVASRPVAGRPIPTSPATGTDALQRRTLAELRGFAQWLTAAGGVGMVGEFAVPGKWAQWGDAYQQDQWNALLEVYLGDADRLGVHTAAWASGPTWDQGYPLALHVGVNAGSPLTIRNAHVPVVAGHPSRAGRFHGLNLSGIEAGVATFGGGTVRSSAGYTPSAADVAFIAADGLDFTRLPVAWERLQPTLGGDLSSTELARLHGVLTAARAQGVSVMVEKHSYGRYTRADGSVVSICGGGITDAQLIDFWTKLSAWLRADPARDAAVVGLGIVNEPHDLPGGAAGWQNTSQAVVTALRQAGETRLIAVGGYGWSSLTDWASNHPTGWISDPAQAFVYEAHHYWDTASDPSLGPRSGTYQQPKPGGGVETLTYARELSFAEAALTAAAALVSGCRVAADGRGVFDAGAATIRSGSRVATGAPARTTPAAGAIVSGTQVALAPSVPAAASLVSGSRVTGSGVNAGASSATIVSGTMVLGDGYAVPAVGSVVRSGSRVDASPLLDVAAAAALTSATRVAGESVRGTAGGASLVSGSRVGGALVQTQPGAATIVSGTCVGAPVPAAEGSTGASIISGTVVLGAVVGTTALVSGVRVQAGPLQVETFVVASLVSGVVVARPTPAALGRSAAAIVSGSVIANPGVPVSSRLAAARAIVSGTRVGAIGGLVRPASGTVRSGSLVTAAARLEQSITASLVSGTVVRASPPNVFTPVFVAPPGPVRERVPQQRRRLLVADTLTGRVLFELPAASLSWNSPLNGVGSARAGLVVEHALDGLTPIGSNGARDPRTALRAMLTGPYRFSFVVAYGTQAVWGGPVTPSDDVADGKITVAAVGLERILERRVLNRANGTGLLSDASRDVVFQETTIGGAIYQLVANGISTYGGLKPNRALPIFCSGPPPMIGERVYRWPSYATAYVWQEIGKLAAELNGPDVRLEPVLGEDSRGLLVRWDLQIGGPFLPASGNFGPNGPLPWTWSDTTAEIRRTVDPSATRTSTFVTGGGQDRDRLIARADSNALTRYGFPELEVVESGGSEQDEGLYSVQARANALATANALPTDTWKLEVPVDGSPHIASVRRGDVARIEVRNKLLIPSGYYYRRITDVAGGDGPTATLSCDVDDAAELVGV